jgi:hypothetical protein
MRIPVTFHLVKSTLPLLHVLIHKNCKCPWVFFFIIITFLSFWLVMRGLKSEEEEGGACVRECVCVYILIKERLLRYLYLVAMSGLSFYVITVLELPACKLWETGCMYVVFSNLDSRSYYTDRDCRFLCFEFL